MPSPYLDLPRRDEPEVRRAKLAASLQAEGASEATIERLATVETVAKMQDYEQAVCSRILQMFGPGSGIK